ncbi:hypothetical protein AAH091_02945, partial [Candidatus Bacteroides intestinigallinarum]|uniref:hypothetical protein n=1 Tax=Candidatus Bacteroides intestinigallinarum TaxID=2838470 RepID=UPI0039B3F626
VQGEVQDGALNGNSGEGPAGERKIQDKFNEAGIEIMSPHYMAVRDGNETTTPKEYQKSNNPSNKVGEENKPD